MIHFFGSNGKELLTDTIRFTTTSTGLNSSELLVVTSDIELTTFDVSLSDYTQDLNLYVTENDGVVTKETLDITDTFDSLQNTNYVYVVRVLFAPSSDGERRVDATLLLDGTEYIFHFGGIATDYDARLIELLQNTKRKITDDYYTGFFESDLEENVKDNVLLNTKRKEYLLGMFDITGFLGAYRSLLAILDLFGYGDLLTIREYWVSVVDSNDFKQTDVTTEVLSYVRNDLKGYTKTNQFALVYQINEADFTDMDSEFEYYVNVLYDTDLVLTKMYAIKKILETEMFLPANAKLIDIIGEYRTVAGIYNGFEVTEAEAIKVNMTEAESAGDVEYLSEDTIAISGKTVMLTNPAFTVENDIVVVDGASAVTDQDYMLIEREITTDDAGLTEDFELMTRLHADDMGIIRMKLIGVDSNVYFRYKLQLRKYDTIDSKEHTVVYETPLDLVTNIPDDSFNIGIRVAGFYSFSIILFDNYGGMNFIDKNEVFTLYDEEIDFDVFRVETRPLPEATYRSTEMISMYKDVKLFSSFKSTVDMLPDTTQFPVIDPIEETLDINTFDKDTNTLQATHYNSEEITYHDLIDTPNNLSGIALFELSDIPLTNFGYHYGVFILDLIDNGADGFRRVGVRLFPSHEVEYISVYYSSIIYPTEEEFIQQIVSLINSDVSSIYKHFTANINYFSDSDILNKKPVLILRGIREGFLTNHIEVIAENDETAVNIEQNDSHIFTYISSNITLVYNGSTIGANFDFVYGDFAYNEENVVFNSLIDVKNKLKTIIEDNELDVDLFVDNTSLLMTVCGKDTLEISHTAIGINRDIFRGNKSSSYIKVPYGYDSQLGDQIYITPKFFSRANVSNMTWTVTDAVTGDVIRQSNSYALKFTPLKKISYDITLDVEQLNLSRTRVGCITVN